MYFIAHVFFVSIQNEEELENVGNVCSKISNVSWD